MVIQNFTIMQIQVLFKPEKYSKIRESNNLDKADNVWSENTEMSQMYQTCTKVGAIISGKLSLSTLQLVNPLSI